MNDQVKLSIDGRKNAFDSAYELTAEDKQKINTLFKDIEELGKTCTDAMDFESKFAANPLNQKYIDLFTEIAQSRKTKLSHVPDPVLEPAPTAGDVAADLAKTEAELAVDGTVQHFRGRAYRAAYDKALKTPVIGDAIGAKNKIDLLRRFKK